MMKKLQLKAVMGQEMGFPGYVRARYQTMMLQSSLDPNADIMSQYFNFKELETMIRSVLTKAGYRMALIEREEAYEKESMADLDGENLQERV